MHPSIANITRNLKHQATQLDTLINKTNNQPHIHRELLFALESIDDAIRYITDATHQNKCNTPTQKTPPTAKTS